VRLLCAAFGAAFLMISATAQALEHHEGGGEATYEMLREGGFVLVMRHAHSPGDQKASVGLSDGCQLAPRRGLDATGFAQARTLGAMLADNEVPILKAYTSRMCRAWDTAALAAGGAVVEESPSQVSTDPAVVTAFKEAVAAELAANPGQNIILASHSNIAPLYGALVDDEEELPEGLISIVDPVSWNGVDGFMLRIRSGVEVVSQSVAVE